MRDNGKVDRGAIGTRIRESRMRRGLRQSDLAKRAEISPSYLNLIEHNRRRIGGRILLRLAAVLDVEPSMLSQGAEAALIAALHEAAGEAAVAERAPPEEFAGRFPGWAQLVVDQHRRLGGLERSVKALTDRLAHDPHLAESLHEVLSMVTAIRSTASILVETPQLEPEWQARFHRNVNEDSHRLAEGARALARYLDSAPGSEADIKSPQDELDMFLSAHGYHFATLEDGTATPEDILAQDSLLTQPAARRLGVGVLTQYCKDAARLPKAPLLAAIAACGLDPIALAARLEVDLPCMLRRLACLPEAEIGPVGLAVSDASGALLIRKPLTGFTVTRMVGGCPLWPLFQAASQPSMPLWVRVQQEGREARPVLALAIAEQIGGLRANMPPLLRSYMLLLPDRDSPTPDRAARVGISCRICAQPGCPARREPSVMQAGI